MEFNQIRYFLVAAEQVVVEPAVEILAVETAAELGALD